MCNADAFQHAFFATGTWLPISHLIRHDYSTELPAASNSATKEEELVKIQHFKEYHYTERITPNAVSEAINKAAAEKAVADAEERRIAAKREAFESAEKLELQPYIDKAAKLLSELEGKMEAYIEVEGDVRTIHNSQPNWV